MQLDGVLSRIGLRDLLELSSQSLVNGALEVYAPTGVHRIFFVQGTCVHVAAPDARGVDALWPLFELADAPFRFVSGANAHEQSITEPIASVIDQAQTRARQWAAIRPAIPHLELVPALIMPANREQVRINEEDWPVLSCVDGTRTIRQIAEYAMLDDVEVCNALLRLQAHGLLVLHSAQPVAAARMPAPEPQPAIGQPAAVPPDAARPNFFAKLLVAAPVATHASNRQVAESLADVPATPTEYDDILRVLRS